VASGRGPRAERLPAERDPALGGRRRGQNVETSGRVADSCSRRWRRSPTPLPRDRGTMNNLTLAATVSPITRPSVAARARARRPTAERDPRRDVEHAEHAGSRRSRPNIRCVCTSWSLRKGSGGDGAYRGGDGIARRNRGSGADADEPDSRAPPPPAEGRAGGDDGAAWPRHASTASDRGQVDPRLEPGDRIRIETPGGGGYGSIK